MRQLIFVHFVVGLLSQGCSHRSVAVTGDGGVETITTRRDGYVPADAGPTPGCTALAGLAGGRHLTDRTTVKALFNSSLTRAFLSTQRVGGVGGDLLSVELPSGNVSTIATEVENVAWLGQESALLFSSRIGESYSPYELRLLPLSGGPAKVLGSGICGHRATPDGSRVYLFRGCTQSSGATLEVVSVATGSSKVLAKNTSGLVVSPDSSRAAFVSGVYSSKGCSPRGEARIVDAAGVMRDIAPKAVARTLQFLPSGKLLFGVMDSCADSPGFQLMAAGPDDSPPTPLGTKHEFGYGYYVDDPYVVSPDGALVLGANMGSGYFSELYAVRTDGGGEILLASNLFSYTMISLAFQAFGFSPTRAVYTPAITSKPGPRMGLASVPSSGGEPKVLSPELFGATYAVSAGTDEAAVVEKNIDSGISTLRLVTIPTGASKELYESPRVIRQPAFVPGGRGLLLVDQEYGVEPTSRLHYVPRGGGSQVIGAWRNSYAWTQMDPGGCVVLYNTDFGPDAGTTLALIPR